MKKLLVAVVCLGSCGSAFVRAADPVTDVLTAVGNVDALFSTQVDEDTKEVRGLLVTANVQKYISQPLQAGLKALQEAKDPFDKIAAIGMIHEPLRRMKDVAININSVIGLLGKGLANFPGGSVVAKINKAGKKIQELSKGFEASIVKPFDDVIKIAGSADVISVELRKISAK